MENSHNNKKHITSGHKSSKSDRQDSKQNIKRKNHLLWLRVIAVTVLSLGILILLWKGCQKKQIVGKPPETRIAFDKYDVLVEVWNKFVNHADLGKEFYLIRLDPDETARRLNILLNPFFTTISQEIENEFQIIRQEDKYSFFKFYHEFLLNHNARKKSLVSTNMSGLEIKDIVYDLTKRDDLDKKTLQIVAAMHNPCSFFQTYKQNLYEKGLDRRIKTCPDIIVDRKKYPCLHSLLIKKAKAY